ncbi:MAG: HEAT repeat domain-containing protein [Ignavibacteria bacterium]|nr:HEAT repeat domain-containing protein [Ignavibacteria bacterium]
METSKIKDYLKSDDIQKVKEALYFLFDNHSYDEEIVILISKLVTSKDRGIQNLAIDCLSQLPLEFQLIASNCIAPLVASDNIEYRNIASDILVKYNDVCYDALIPFLSHPIDDVRQFTLDIWGNIGSTKNWKIVHSLLNDPNKNVVISAIMALGNIKVPDVIDDLIKKYEEDDEYKPFVLNSLGKIGGEKAKEFILNVISNESDQLLQLAAIDAIGYFDASIEFLDYLLSKLPLVPRQVQPYFLKAICKIGKLYCEIRKFPQELREIARESLKQEDLEIRRAALTALGNSYDIFDVDCLIQELLRFDLENIEIIFQNIIHNSSLEVLSDFLEKLTYQKDNGEIFASLLEFFFREWDAIQESKKIVIINSILSFSEELPDSILFDFCDWYNYKEPEVLRTVFFKLYQTQSFVNKAKLEEIGAKYDLL